MKVWLWWTFRQPYMYSLWGLCPEATLSNPWAPPAIALHAWPGAHLLGRTSGWDISLTRRAPGRLLLPPAQPCQPLGPGSPGPRPSRRSFRCACRCSSCPRGPAHSPLWGGGRDGQIDRWVSLECPSDPKAGSEGFSSLKTPSLHVRDSGYTRSRGVTFKSLLMRAWNDSYLKHEQAAVSQKPG